MLNKFSTLTLIEGGLALAFFIVFCIYFIPSPDHEIRLHDTFDGNFSTRHVLIHSGHFFDTSPTSIVPGIMNGLPRGVFPRFTELTGLLMFFFGSLGGFSLTFLVVRFVAFVGIYLFGRDHLNIKNEQKGLLTLIAVAFACLPFFVVQGITVSGIPLLFWAFFNLIKKQKVLVSYFVIVLFGFWSHLVLVGFHTLLILGILTCLICVVRKKIVVHAFIGLILLTLIYVLSDYMLFYLHYFDSSYQTSRAEFEKVLGLNLKGVIGGTFKNFFSGDFSTANYFGLLVSPFLIYFFFALFKNKNEPKYKIASLFIAMTFFCAFLISLLDWKNFAFFYHAFPFAKVFNFKRFNSLLPGLFFLSALACIVAVNQKESRYIHLASTVLVTVLLIFIWRGNISHNRSGFDTSGLKIDNQQQITFNQFFDPQLYRQIKKEIGIDTVNYVIHLGISPSPSKYAGLNVLDDYQGDYPIEYKGEFRKIIEGELNKSIKLKKYFDEWGSRCYLSSAQLFENRSAIKNGFLYEANLSINTTQIKKMNCNYIISSLLIGNTQALNLNLQKVLVSSIDLKTFFLYKISD